MHGPARPGECGGDAITIFLLRATTLPAHEASDATGQKLAAPNKITRPLHPSSTTRRGDDPRRFAGWRRKRAFFSAFSTLKCLAFSRAEKAVDRSGAELLAFHWKNRKKTNFDQ